MHLPRAGVHQFRRITMTSAYTKKARPLSMFPPLPDALRKKLRPEINHGYSRVASTKWGYAVYRTTYTPESDTMFPIALQKLDDWVEAEFENAPILPGEKGPMMSSFRNKIVDDKALFDGFTVPDIYQHWQDFIRSESRDHFVGSARIADASAKTVRTAYQIPELIHQGDAESNPDTRWNMYSDSLWNLSSFVCIWLDEEALRSIIENPVDLREDNHFDATIKVVMEECNEDTYDRAIYYDGWAYIGLSEVPLAFLHDVLETGPVGEIGVHIWTDAIRNVPHMGSEFWG